MSGIIWPHALLCRIHQKFMISGSQNTLPVHVSRERLILKSAAPKTAMMSALSSFYFGFKCYQKTPLGRVPLERPKFESVARNLIKIFPNASERPKFKPFAQNLVNFFPTTVLQVLIILFLLNIRNSLTIQIVPSPSPLSTCQESHSALSVYMASGASLAEWHECYGFLF